MLTLSRSDPPPDGGPIAARLGGGAACSAASDIAPIGSSLTSAPLDARIDRGLRDIDQEIEDHEEQRQHQDGALQQRQIALEDRGIEQDSPEPGQENTVSIRIEPPSM